MPEENINVTEYVNPVVDDGTVGEEDDVKLFNKEDEVVEEGETKEKEEVEEKEEESKEESGEREKEGEVESEELQTSSIHARPSWKDVTSKYPKFFKEFPQIREALGREREFDEIFPEGIDSAREAVESAKDFSMFEEKFTNGDAKTFLEVIKDTGKSEISNFTRNFLPALKDIDSNLYMEVTARPLVDALQSMYYDADRNGNDNLKNVALYAAKYFFNDHRFATGEVKLKDSKEEKPREDNTESKKIQEERRALLVERYQDARNYVDNQCLTKLESIIRSELPDSLSEYDTEHVIKDIIGDLDRTIASDAEHRRNMTRLWELAEKGKFGLQERSRLINAYMNKAKGLLSDVRRKHVARATKGNNSAPERRPEVVGNSSGRRSGRTNREIDYRKTSDEDLFSGRISYK